MTSVRLQRSTFRDISEVTEKRIPWHQWVNITPSSLNLRQKSSSTIIEVGDSSWFAEHTLWTQSYAQQGQRWEEEGSPQCKYSCSAKQTTQLLLAANCCRNCRRRGWRCRYIRIYIFGFSYSSRPRIHINMINRGDMNDFRWFLCKFSNNCLNLLQALFSSTFFICFFNSK